MNINLKTMKAVKSPARYELAPSSATRKFKVVCTAPTSVFEEEGTDDVLIAHLEPGNHEVNFRAGDGGVIVFKTKGLLSVQTAVDRMAVFESSGDNFATLEPGGTHNELEAVLKMVTGQGNILAGLAKELADFKLLQRKHAAMEAVRASQRAVQPAPEPEVVEDDPGE